MTNQNDFDLSTPTRLIKTLSLTAICLGYFMVILDTTVVTVALPTIQREPGATVSDLQWIVDVYTLVFACLLLTAGALGDRLGNRRTFLLTLLFVHHQQAQPSVAE